MNVAQILRVTIIYTRDVSDIIPSNLDIEELDRACNHIADQVEKKFRAAFAGEADNVVVAVEPRTRAPY
ncbi:MAG: hypothetical protein A2Y60_05700 [Chloroflexi bacterium RBG_13_54_9]|nr:MAG: hypothetical protein A2Y60_05700 [Chloroflexi bacterium RBG_13_54_9]